jgi:hypothetical protein
MGLGLELRICLLASSHELQILGRDGSGLRMMGSRLGTLCD